MDTDFGADIANFGAEIGADFDAEIGAKVNAEFGNEFGAETVSLIAILSGSKLDTELRLRSRIWRRNRCRNLC